MTAPELQLPPPPGVSFLPASGQRGTIMEYPRWAN